MSTILYDWRLYAILSAVFASLTAVLAKIGIEGVPSNLATLIRTIVILLFLFVLDMFTKEFKVIRELSQRNWLFLILSGLATGFSWICYFRALQLGPISRVAPVDKASLVLTVLLAVIFLGETISWKAILGIAFILAGSIILIL